MKRISIFLVALLLTAVSFAQVKDYRNIKYPAPEAPQIVKPFQFKLKNGLTVLFMEDHELPIVSGRILFHTGSVADPAGKAGLAALVGDTMRTAGNSRIDGDRMDDFLESIAASVESFAGDTSAGVSFRCLKENTDKTLDLFQATIKTPVFAEKQVDVSKEQVKTGIMRRNDDPKGIAAREFNRRVYGLGSPLSAMEELATINAITIQDLKDFHKMWYVPDNAVLAVWGDFNRKEMEKKITELFRDWKPAPVKLPSLNIHSEKPGVYFVHRDAVTQSNIVFGHLGQMRNNPDLPAMAIFSRLLGGGFESRLMKTIRRDMGLSYSPHGGIGTGWNHPGIFSIRINTKLESTAKVIEVAKSIVADIQKNGVTEEELNQSRDAYINSFVFQFDSLDKIIGRALTYKFYGYPENFTETLFSGLKKVSRDDIKRVANKYVHMENAVIMVVGDESKFDKPLSEFGTVTPVDVTIPKPEIKEAAVVSTAKSLKEGSDILRKAIDKMDPKHKLDKVKIWQMKVKTLIQQGGQQIALDATSSIRYPDSIVREMTTPMGAMRMIVTPEKAVMSMGPNSQPLPPAQAAALKNAIATSLPMLAKLARGEKNVANLVKTGDFNGQAAYFVSVPLGDKPETYVISTKDFTILGTTGKDVDRAGNIVSTTGTWTDFRDFAGILFPASMEEVAGKNQASVKVEAIVINPENGDQLFN